MRMKSLHRLKREAFRQKFVAGDDTFNEMSLSRKLSQATFLARRKALLVTMDIRPDPGLLCFSTRRFNGKQVPPVTAHR